MKFERNRKRARLELRLSEQDRELFDLVAEAEHSLSTSDWARRMLVITAQASAARLGLARGSKRK